MPEVLGQASFPHARVQALVASFARIGEATMRGLPFYNEALTVEAIGFERHGDDDWLGALITPWFLNLMLVPELALAYDEAATGQKREVTVPGGVVTFRCGGTEDFGLFHAFPVASPVGIYKSQEQARAAARQALARFRTAPEQELPKSPGQAGVSRRTLFRFPGRSLNSSPPS